VRRAVLGDEHVDRALSRAGPLDAAFQDLVTRWAWGEIWSRPGLPRRTRSLVTVAMLVALNRTEELRLHLGAALRNGVTTPEIEELLLHAAAYCGIPAANAAFREAKEVLGDGGQRRGRGPSTRRRLRRRRARGERVGRG
jgi:4-carboxymuconolactone decarboxylase